tara:strand:- start:242 stop:424 length:183 start_codon:yes stop_codon:yes gene_type:complete
MLKGWKTFLVALAVAVFGALEGFDFTSFLTEENAGYVTTAIGVVMFLLRSTTKTAVFKNG